MGSTKQQNEPCLTPELWAKVFAHLELRPDPIFSYHDGSRQKQNQAQVHQLKLVCKQFRSVYESHSEIVQRLYLDLDFSAALLPSLLAWLHQNKGTVRVFWSNCKSSLVDAVMAALVSAPNMNTLDICGVSACSISLAGTYKRLEKCSFRHLKEEHVGLAPLGSLPRLRQLRLEGNFQELHHLTGLTRLECMGGRVLGAQEFPPALQYLELGNSDLVGVHPQTLPACTALTHLGLGNASLKGNNAYVYLDRNLSVVPTNIGQLTRLGTLCLSTGTGAEGEPAELKWVSELTSLHELRMYFGHSRDDILQHVSLLENLTYLKISNYNLMDEAYLLHVNIEWHKLQALCKLFLEEKTLRLGDNIFSLLQLPKLQEVSFAESTVHGPNDTSCLAALIYKFATRRPQVKLVFGNGGLVG